MFISVNFSPQKSESNVCQTILDYSSIESNGIWDAMDGFGNVNILIENLTKLVNDNKKVISKNRKKGKKIWMNEEIVHCIEMREFYFKQKRKYSYNIDVSERYIYYKKKVQKMIKEAKKTFCDSVIEKDVSNPKALWSLYQRIMYNKDLKTKSVVKSLEVDNITYENERDISQKFNDYFTNVTQMINCSTDPLDVDYIKIFPSDVLNPFIATQVTENEVQCIIKNLKVGTATGNDNVSSKFLKKFSTKISSILSRFANKMFEDSVFPSCLKDAIVTPIHKSGITTLTSNYRPISVLNSTSKIFETLVKNRLESYLSSNGVISEHQYGFSPNSNTTAACVSLTNFIYKSIDRKLYVSCIFLDFKKAFDSVDHEILILKLQNIGLPQSIVDLFESYLQLRRQAVRIGNVVGDFQTVSKGVPQGSILGPYLFKIYINDVTKLPLHGKIQLFADDAVLMYGMDDEFRLGECMQSDMNTLEEWLSKHRLALNVEKTKIILFKNRTFIPNFDVRFNNTQVGTVTKYTYLGLTIDDKLNWYNHIDSVKKKITPYVFILHRLRKYLSDTPLYSIYCAHILSHLNYLNPIWSSSSKYKIDELKIIVKRAIKIIHRFPIRYPTNLIYSEKYISWEQLTHQQLLVLAFKIVHNEIKHNFELPRVNAVHEHETRTNSNFYIENFKTEKYKSNCFYRCLCEYNKLPESLKLIDSVQTFKREVKKYIVDL